MSMALALNTQSLLPACLSHLLATPSSNEIEQLWWRYQAELKSIQEADALLKSGKFNSALHYLLRSSHRDHRVNASFSESNLDVAVKLLMASYWEEAIGATDIKEHMPANRKLEWYEQINELTFPDFSKENLYSTLTALLNERDRFFAERVDGFYRALSGDHKTNSINPAGFYHRFIVANCHEDGYVNGNRADQISDLRYVIAKFTKREGVPSWRSSHELIRILLRRPGEWHEIDNGAFKIKAFKRGTIHLEVHPDLAWRLNEVLAILYPRALPPESRKPNEKAVKTFNLTKNLIPFDVLEALSDLKPAYERDANGKIIPGRRMKNAVSLYGVHDKHLYAKCKSLLELIGGVELWYGAFGFDYQADEVIRTMVITGLVPDHVSHQYFPTPEPLAERMVSMLEALPGDRLLEPSAGLGAIATKLHGQVTCIEVDPLFASALSAKGLKVITADFLKWSKDALARNELFAGIVMNPPFSLGRAFEHIQCAVKLLQPSGVLVALAPAGCAKKLSANDAGFEVFDVDPAEFPGVSVELKIIRYKQG